MLSLYSNPDAIKEITSNTLRNVPDSVTWDLIISTAHQIILDVRNLLIYNKESNILNYLAIVK